MRQQSQADWPGERQLREQQRLLPHGQDVLGGVHDFRLHRSACSGLAGAVPVHGVNGDRQLVQLLLCGGWYIDRELAPGELDLDGNARRLSRLPFGLPAGLQHVAFGELLRTEFVCRIDGHR